MARRISNQWSVVGLLQRVTENPACPQGDEKRKNETIPNLPPDLRHLLPVFRLTTDLPVTDYSSPPLTSCHLTTPALPQRFPWQAPAGEGGFPE